MENIKLIGAWPSPFMYRVIWALELKGIKYDYIEEDLKNKSSLLLKCNPVFKRIPVLLHNDKPVCESLIIIQYLDEIFPHQYPLLPNDPYEKALLQFWAKFADDKGISIWMLFRTRGEEQTKAKQDTLDMLTALEEHGLMNSKYFGGQTVGIADLSVGSMIYWLEVIEQTVERKLFEAISFPRLYKWFNNFKEDPIIKKNLPDQQQMFAFFKKQRELLMADTSM